MYKFVATFSFKDTSSVSMGKLQSVEMCENACLIGKRVAEFWLNVSATSIGVIGAGY